MVIRWFLYRHRGPIKPAPLTDYPYVTVQVPLYNERFVAERIVDACVALEYPKSRLQIQILDDSTDDTQQIVRNQVLRYRSLGIDIEHLTRSNRSGFKAGALKEAMALAKGDFIAIFDADFIPEPNTLKSAMRYFSSSTIAMVQLRWGHLNKFNLFTKTQAVMLDAHFSLEQRVRSVSSKLFNFNGTAGIWRKCAIVDAGNWSDDTLTEDLDLSYRAQLKGWRMAYVNDLECPGEIPTDMNAFKSQQHRWAKGGVQVMKKLLSEVWRAKLPLSTKLESTFHLSNNLAYLVTLIDTVFLLVPSIVIRELYEPKLLFWLDIPMLALASGGHLLYLFFGQIALGYPVFRSLFFLPLLMLLGIQLAFNNARAGLEALMGKSSEFVRTPKTGECLPGVTAKGTAAFNYKVKLPKSAAVEFIISCVYLVILVWAIYQSKWFMLPFLVFLVVGFMTTAMASARHHFLVRKLP